MNRRRIKSRWIIEKSNGVKQFLPNLSTFRPYIGIYTEDYQRQHPPSYFHQRWIWRTVEETRWGEKDHIWIENNRLKLVMNQWNWTRRDVKELESWKKGEWVLWVSLKMRRKFDKLGLVIGSREKGTWFQIFFRMNLKIIYR